MATTLAETAYQEAIVAALQELDPGCRIGVLPGMRLRVALTSGRTLSMGMLDAFQAFLVRGGRHEDLVPAATAHARATMDAVTAADSSEGGSPGQETFEAACRCVLPLLESESFFDGADQAMRDGSKLLRLPIIEGELTAALVLPLAGRSMRFLSTKDVERWDRPPELIEHQARRNLKQRLQGQLTLSLHQGVSATVDTSTWFKASLVLSAAFRLQLIETLGERAVVALPERDTLRAFAQGEREAWEGMLPGVMARYERAPHPLSFALFEVEPAGLRVAGRLPEA